jgi:hypothetical protein
MLHEYHVIYSVRYYLWFHISAVGLGTYYPVPCSQLLQDGLVRQHSHGLHRNSTRDGSYQSTPDEQLSVSVGGLMSGRVPSESDLSSNISDDVLVTPGNKLNGLHIQTSSSLVSADEVLGLTTVIGGSD